MLIICHLPTDERLTTASLHMMSWLSTLDFHMRHAKYEYLENKISDLVMHS